MTLNDHAMALARLLDQAHQSAHNITLSSAGWELIALDLREAAEHAKEVAFELKKLEKR